MDSEHPTTELNKTDYTQKGKKGRVIIRNLVWDITQKHLRALFSEFGQIEDINIPINPTNNKGRGFAFVEFVNRNSALNAIRKLNGTTYKGRQIILDSAVGKDKFATPNTKPEVLEAPEVNEDPATIEEQEEPIQAEPQQPKAKKVKPIEDLAPTVFVRNLPLDVSEETVVEFFSKFGEVRFAKLVRNKDTHQTKGTAFVRFKDGQTAVQVLQKSNDLEQLYKRLKYSKDQSRKDELDLLNADFEMEGRRIFVFEAMNRQDIVDTTQTAKPVIKPTKDIRQVKHLKQLIPYDPHGTRNLKLCAMGIFEPEESMTAKEQQRREEHVRTKLQKLKNPNFYISDCRIAIKNLPRSENLETALEGLVQDAMWWDNVQLPTKQKISRIWVAKDRSVVLPKDQEAPNTGLAFIEFSDPSYALTFMNFVGRNRDKVLAALHNKVPIIEFAIEDARKLRRIEMKRERQREIVQQTKQAKIEANGGKETRTQKKNKVSNKLLIDNILARPDCHEEENLEKVRSLWNELKSRGMKQRLRQKIERKLNIQLGPQQQPKVEKAQKATENKKPKIQPKGQTESKSPAQKMKDHFEGLMESIKTQVLKRKRDKAATEEYDEVDELGERRLARLQKKVK